MSREAENSAGRRLWQRRAFAIIFEATTPAGKAFDIALIALIVASVAAVSLESVAAVQHQFGPALRAFEWIVTALFAAEYALRLACVRRPSRYIFSFYGLVDLLAVLPAPASLFLPGAQSLLAVRALRLIRIMRVFKLASYLNEANVLLDSLREARDKILVFLGTVFVITLPLGTVMYWLEGGANGFDSIPRAVYWAIVTITTVGYGDITPVTTGGQVLAAVVMMLGYAIIAVPTGIVTAEIVRRTRGDVTTRTCPSCTTEGHIWRARYCRDCGAPLPDPRPEAPEPRA